MSDDYTFTVTVKGRVTGRLIFRDLTAKEELQYCDDRVKTARRKQNLTEVRCRYFDKVLTDAENLKRHGHEIKTSDPAWREQIPPLIKEAIFVERFEDGGADEDDEKKSEGPSES